MFQGCEYFDEIMKREVNGTYFLSFCLLYIFLSQREISLSALIFINSESTGSTSKFYIKGWDLMDITGRSLF